MTKPKRIQRKRTKGWKMPGGAIYVGRPTKWGNPFPVGQGYSRQAAVAEFKKVTSGDEIRMLARQELRGHDLACWCRLDQPCHADVLLQIANEEKE